MARDDSACGVGWSWEQDISPRLGGRISGEIAEEASVGRTGETGPRQRARIPRAYAVDRPGNSLAVEIADREHPRVVAEIVGVGEPSRGEIARSAVDHGPEGVAAEGPDTGCRQAGAHHPGNPGVEVVVVFADNRGAGRIRGSEITGPIAPLQKLAAGAEAAPRQIVAR